MMMPVTESLLKTGKLCDSDEEGSEEGDPSFCCFRFHASSLARGLTPIFAPEDLIVFCIELAVELDTVMLINVSSTTNLYGL